MDSCQSEATPNKPCKCRPTDKRDLHTNRLYLRMASSTESLSKFAMLIIQWPDAPRVAAHLSNSIEHIK